MTGQPGPVPLTVWLAGQRVVVVGAGHVAAAKLAALGSAGADVVVVAPDAVAGIRAAAEAGELSWRARTYETADVEAAVLVIAATADAQVNARVEADCSARATLCVRADGGGTAALAAAVRRGPLLLTVSTGGTAPALAARLRRELERTYGQEYGQLATLLGELRADPAIRARLAGLDAGARGARWRAVLDADILHHIRNGRADLAREVAIACLSSSTG